MNLSSKLLSDAVNEFAGLPGIGKKTALRLVLHLLKQDASKVSSFADSLTKLRQEAIYCKECFNLSDKEVCDICSSSARNKDQICQRYW